MNHKDLPIFCDNCAALALAELDSAPLCGECLVKAVKRAGKNPIASRIEPLKFNEPKIIVKPFATPKDAII